MVEIPKSYVYYVCINDGRMFIWPEAIHDLPSRWDKHNSKSIEYIISKTIPNATIIKSID